VFRVIRRHHWALPRGVLEAPQARLRAGIASFSRIRDLADPASFGMMIQHDFTRAENQGIFDPP
jgi:hypothetical protein